MDLLDTMFVVIGTRGRGVHDVWIDGDLPPYYQKGTLFLILNLAFIPTFMINFGAKLLIFDYFLRQANPPMFEENLSKRTLVWSL